MHNVALIAKREYLERIKTKGFLIATMLIPTLIGGGIFGVATLASKTKSSSHLVIVADSQQPAADLEHELELGKDSHMKIDIVAPTPDPRASLDQQLRDKKLDGYLWITPPPAGSAPYTRPTFDFTSQSTADIATHDSLVSALRTVLTRESLAGRGMNSAQVDELMKPIVVNTIGANGQRGDSVKAFGVAYVLFFLMYMVVLIYGMNVARSIIEEKSSRIFEVLLATIKPDELLAGKIIGVGAVGLTQVTIWMVVVGTIAARFGAASSLSISPTQIVFFIVYFLLGYLLYSSTAAALGAMTNSEQELQQLNMFLMLPLFLCMLMLPVVITNPSSTLTRIVSQIPFCAPLLMNLRVSLHMPEWWEIALSIALILITTLGVLWVSARIYRVGILMYGKKPNLPEIMRWLKYS